MLHEYNAKALNVSASMLASRYLAYLASGMDVTTWYSQFAPEWGDGQERAYLALCKAAHEIGF